MTTVVLVCCTFDGLLAAVECSVKFQRAKPPVYTSQNRDKGVLGMMSVNI